jgi:mono/diheme cytochrome c family protein
VAASAQAKDPATNFMMECQGCHAIDGSGNISAIPALKNYMAKFLTVPGGREFLVQVPGAAQAPLSDAETAEVLNYLLKKFGPLEIAQQYPPYTAEEVARLRKTPLTEVKQKRAALVKLIEQQEKKHLR